MARGPIDLAVLMFPGNTFRGGILPAISRFIANDIVQIVDLLFVSKDEDGNVTILELTDLEDASYLHWDLLVGAVSGLLSREDAASVAHMVPAGTIAAVVLLENSWVAEMISAVRRANGAILLNERIPAAVIDQIESSVSSA